MADCIVKVGMSATFDPFRDHTNSNGVAAQISYKVTGTVVYVNEPHHWFSVRYGEGERISFLFADVGTGPGKKVVLS